MTDNIVVKVNNLSKRFKIYRSPWARALEWASYGKKVYHQDFWALKDVSFEVKKGECLGIIGLNGAGKSTLLKILTRSLYPTTGTFEVRGPVLSLLELGTGFNQELTGRQNIYCSSQLLGFPENYVSECIQDIQAFAELGEFFDRPIKTYSSGMYVRLAFSMFAFLRPDVLIVDEALSVGDIFFVQKCFKRIREILEMGTTFLLVTHDMSAAAHLCSKAMWLHEGSIRIIGDSERCIKEYIAFSNVGSNKASAASQINPNRSSGIPAHKESLLLTNKVRLGNQWAKISRTWLVDDNNCAVVSVEHGEFIKAILEIETDRSVHSLSTGIELSDRMGQVVFATGLRSTGRLIPKSEPGQKHIVVIRFQVLLAPGEYTIDLGCGGLYGDEDAWDRVLHCARIIVLKTGNELILGLVCLPHEITVGDFNS